MTKIRIQFLLLIFLISCKQREAEKSIETSFKTITYSLQYNYLDTIGKKIVPNDNYQYWAYSTYYERYGDGKIKRTVLNEAGDTLLKKKALNLFKPYGFFQGGHPSYRCNFVLTIKNGKTKYIRSAEEFRNFIGDIDNLEEAILLAHTFGYRLDTELKARQYKEIKDGYQLRLMKYHEFPRSKELIDIKILKNGFIKTQSLGIYKKGEEIID